MINGEYTPFFLISRILHKRFYTTIFSTALPREVPENSSSLIALSTSPKTEYSDKLKELFERLEPIGEIKEKEARSADRKGNIEIRIEVEKISVRYK